MTVQSKEIGAIVLSPWGKALAGALAAMLANTLVYPLDIAKTRLQVRSKEGDTSVLGVLVNIYKHRGIKALYTGLGGTLAGTVSTNFAYFYWYSLLRTMYTKRNRPLNTATELAVGALAGAIAQLCTIPVAVVTTRQQAEEKSFLSAAKEVYTHDGICGFWRGLKASLILVVNPSITYGAASRLRTLLFSNRAYLSVYENFLLGAVSKSLATFATQPLIVAKVIQQSSNRFRSFVEVLRYLLKNEGLQGLFRGIRPQLAKGVLVQGLLLAFKDQVEAYFVRIIASPKLNRLDVL